jgi:DNA (cytosine-5)-methyltransferase 1
MNYYNEFDPFAAAWLRELIKEGLIPNGEVDERSIIDVNGKDLKGFTQCHFFTGIGGWSYALELAGWSADRPVWTGSPPCQPFSVAGNKKGQDDERHLWPHFFSLIRECKPATVFGEQVAAAIRKEWFDDLQSDMEAEGYATAMAVLPACSVGAPQKRDRLFWVADSNSERKHPRIYRVEQERNKEEDSETFWYGKGVKYGDDKIRLTPTEPALFPLADGIPNRMGLLRGAGNAIVPQVAAEVIKAYMSYASQESQV